MEHVILIVGPHGAGKTTAVKAASVSPVVSADSFDFGRFETPDGEEFGLFAVSAKDVVANGLRTLAVGVIVLIDGTARDATAALAQHLNPLQVHAWNHTLIVGVTHTDVAASPGIDTARLLHSRASVPIIEVDVRDRLQASILLQMLLARIAANRMREHAD